MTAIRVVEILNQAGLPKGVLNIVTGPGSTAGEELISNPKVRRVAFTGASDTGKHIMEVAGRQETTDRASGRSPSTMTSAAVGIFLLTIG
jgi:aldehyde dehydrogenase (NAD+)